MSTDQTREELARELVNASKACLSELRGIPWETAEVRVREALSRFLAERFPALPAQRVTELVEQAVYASSSRLRIDFDNLVEALLTGK